MSTQRNIILAVFLCGMLGCQDKHDVELLIDARTVETDTVGDAALPSQYYVALTNLMASKTAVGDLKTLFKDSRTAAGRLYALYGLSVLDRPTFDKLSRQVDSSEQVAVLNYCIKDTVTTKDLLAEIADGRARKKLPFELKKQ